WDTTSVAAASGIPNRFGGQVLTRSTGGVPLLLPMQLEGNLTREIIKRMLPSDTSILREARYQTKAQVRILIDDEGNSATDSAGVPTTQGVYLSTFNPVPMPAGAANNNPGSHGGGRALWRIFDNNTAESNSYNEGTSPRSWNQQQQNGAAVQADTVRGIKAPPPVKAITSVTKVSGSPIKITVNNH